MDKVELTWSWQDKVAMLASKEAMASQHVAKYFVTISRRTAMRRLHMTGCFVKPDRCCEVVFMDEVSPTPSSQSARHARRG